MTKDEMTEALAPLGWTFEELPPAKDAQGRMIVVCTAKGPDGYTMANGYQCDLGSQGTNLCRQLAYQGVLEGVIARVTT